MRLEDGFETVGTLGGGDGLEGSNFVAVGAEDLLYYISGEARVCGGVKVHCVPSLQSTCVLVLAGELCIILA